MGERGLESRNGQDRHQSNVPFHPQHVWKTLLRQMHSIVVFEDIILGETDWSNGREANPWEADAAPGLFSVSTSPPVSVLILDQDKRQSDLLQTATFHHGTAKLTPQLSPLCLIYLSPYILYHLIKNVLTLVCSSGCSVALATKFSHKY